MHPRLIILLCAFVAMVGKLYCAATTYGTNDVNFFHGYGVLVEQDGLMGLYARIPLFNHPPLVGWYCQLGVFLERAADIPFSLFLRFPGIIADFVAVLALLWLRQKTGQPPWWTLALFALSPVLFMVSGFHGNTDSIMAVLLLLATCACLAGSPVAAGVLLACACQIKIVPLLFVPLLFAWWMRQHRGKPFALAFVLVLLAGWSWPLLCDPLLFAKRVLGYGGFTGQWGFPFLLHNLHLGDFESAGYVARSSAQVVLNTTLKLLMIAFTLWAAWRVWRQPKEADLLRGINRTWAAIFVFAPGFAAQYMVWPQAFLAAALPRRYALLTCVTSIYLFQYYTEICNGHLPWDTALLESHHPLNFVAAHNVVWALWIGFFVSGFFRKK